MNLEIRLDKGSVIFKVRAVPGAKKPGIAGVHAGALKVKVASPPERGRANAEITELLSSALCLRKKDVEILKGLASKDKTLRITGTTPEKIIKLSEEA